MSQKDITILLTLYNRANFTKIWLSENYCEQLNFFVADGSRGNENGKVFDKFNKSNLTYKRFPHDEHIEMYFKKIIKSLELIKTNYVMISDNDDFINKKGINKIVNFLSKNKKYDFAGGDTIFIKSYDRKINSENKYFFITQIYQSKELSDTNKEDSVKNYLSKQSSYVWYSIYRRETLLKVFNIMLRLKIFKWELIEIFHTIISLNLGRYAYVRCCPYIRLASHSQSITVKYKEKNPKSIYELLVADHETKKQLDDLINFLHSEYNFNAKLMRILFLDKFKIPEPIVKSTLFKKIKRKILPNIFIYFKSNINSIRRIINLFY